MPCHVRFFDERRRNAETECLRHGKKKRHLYLLEKTAKGKSLTPSELAELEKFEGKSLPPGVVDTQEKVARHFGVSVRTVQYWCRDGAPKTQEGWFNLQDIKKWRDEKEQQNRGPRDTEKVEWEKRKLKAQAELAEMELKRQREELIPKADVEVQWVQRIQEVKKALMSLPRRLAPQVAGLDVKEAQRVIETRVIEILEGFARG